MAQPDESHRFDRRSTDVNVQALAVRVAGLEARIEVVEKDMKANARELLANTALTRQVHEKAERIEKGTADIVEAVAALGALWNFSSKWGRRIAIFSKYAAYVVGLGVAILTALHLRK